MALTSYTIVAGSSASDLATKVKDLLDDGQVLVGESFIRAGTFYQGVGKGTYDSGYAVTDFQMIGASNPTALQEAVADVLTATLQPFGAPIIREGSLFQVMVKPDAGGSTSSVAWANITDKPTTFAPVTATTTVRGGVLKTDTIDSAAAITAAEGTASKATDAAGAVTDLNTLITNYNALRTDVTSIRSSHEALLTALRTAGVVSS